jgi:hypothetical protein
VFVSTCSDLDEVPICVEIHDWHEPMKCVQCHAREGFNGPLQLQIIGVECRV